MRWKFPQKAHSVSLLEFSEALEPDNPCSTLEQFVRNPLKIPLLDRNSCEVVVYGWWSPINVLITGFSLSLSLSISLYLSLSLYVCVSLVFLAIRCDRSAFSTFVGGYQNTVIAGKTKENPEAPLISWEMVSKDLNSPLCHRISCPQLTCLS